MITEGIWQQNIHFEDLKVYLDGKINKIFHILTFIARIRVDTVCYKGYLQPLILKTEAYGKEKCFMPQWLQIEDVEFLVNLAENDELDLEGLFLEKTIESNRSERFDMFLFKKYHRRMSYNKELRDLFMKLLELAKEDFKK